MAASRPNLTPAQRDQIFELKKRGKSGTAIAEICARGTEQLRPFSVSPQHANTVAKRVGADRGELYVSQIGELADAEAIDNLVARLLAVAERESERLDRLQKAGKLDGKKLAALASALERIIRMSERRAVTGDGGGAAKKPDNAGAVPEPPSFAEGLINGAEQSGPEPPTAEVADVVVGAHGGSFAPLRAQAVPSDLPDQDTATAT